MSVQLIDETCLQCGNANWVNNGDTSDLTVSDVEAIRCWSCSHEFFIGEDLDLMYGDDVTPSDVMIEDGKQTAAEAV